MENGKELISTKRLMFCIGCFIQGSTLLTYQLAVFTKQESWITVILGILISVPVIWIYIALTRGFPGKSLIEINDIVLGKVLGRVFSVLYVLFFLSLATLNTRDLGNFTKGFVLEESPIEVLMILLIFLCCYAIRKGVRTMTRYGTIIVIVTVEIMIFDILLLLKDMKLDNLLPVFSLPLKNYLIGAHVVATLPLCEIIAFFMIFPDLINKKGAGRALKGGFIIGAVTLFVVVVRDIAVLGPGYSIVSTPGFLALRHINVGDIFTRMELLYAVTLIVLFFFKVSIVFYAAVYGISRLLNLKTHKFIVPSVGAIIIVFAINVFESPIQHAEWAIDGTAEYFGTVFEFLLPVVTLSVAAARGMLKKEGEKQP